MKKTLLESLTIDSNKNEVERTKDLILSSIEGRVFEMKSFTDIYKECSQEIRKKIIDTSLWHIDSKIDEIEELANMLNQLKEKDVNIAQVRNHVHQLNHKNVYSYDNAIEEIYLEMATQSR